jgi:hypothetical protein
MIDINNHRIITLSVEPVEGATFVHGFHLGTQESVARMMAAELFFARNAAAKWTRTVALIRNGKMIDCFDGHWSSEYANECRVEGLRYEPMLGE